MTVEDFDTLQALVEHYGVHQVARELIEIVRADDESSLLEVGRRSEYDGLQSISTADIDSLSLGD